MDVPGVRRTESHFEGARGAVLFQRTWLPPRPERVLLLVHGLGEHSGRYERLADWFASRGCAVHAYDQQGHGRSLGRRGHVRRFEDLVDDLVVFLDRVRGEHRGLPLFPVGHSMGGLVLVSTLRERQPGVVGAVLSGPALSLEALPSRARMLATRALRLVAPRLRLDAGIDAEALSRDPEVVRAYRADPWVGRRITTSLAAELLSALRRSAAADDVPGIPLLLLHGEDDSLCPIGGSRELHARLDPSRSRLISYPQLRHEIFQEPERARVFDDVLGWLHEVESGKQGGIHDEAVSSG